MNLDKNENFNRFEKISILKLIIKIAGADGEISSAEQESIEAYTSISNLRTSQDFISSAIEQPINEIIDTFESRSNIKLARKIINEYAELHSIHPDMEGIVLENIEQGLTTRTKQIKFSFAGTVKAFGRELGFLWGQESIRPEIKIILAMIFSILACLFGSFAWVDKAGLFTGDELSLISPDFPHIVFGMLIYLALVTRGFLSAPTSFRNIIFFFVNLYLFSLMMFFVIGDSTIEQVLTITPLIGLVAMLWIGMKELLGVFLFVLYAWVVYKLISIGNNMYFDYPFIAFAFLGLIFQSDKFLPKFSSLADSFVLSNRIEKEVAKESLSKLGSAAKATARVATSKVL